MSLKVLFCMSKITTTCYLYSSWNWLTEVYYFMIMIIVVVVIVLVSQNFLSSRMREQELIGVGVQLYACVYK